VLRGYPAPVKLLRSLAWVIVRDLAILLQRDKALSRGFIGPLDMIDQQFEVLEAVGIGGGAGDTVLV
jgi:hypothetical protein